MKVSRIFREAGLMISPSSGEQIPDLDFHEIVSLFEKHGVIIFRDFDLDTKKVTSVTDIYTQKYAFDATRKSSPLDRKVIQSVEYDATLDHTMHSEASYSAVWPEVIWFYCNIAPKEGGATTFCDGIELWNALTARTKEFFLSNPLRYDIRLPFVKSRPGKGKRQWISNVPGAGNAFIDYETGDLYFTLLRFAVNEARIPNQLCFVNHLQVRMERSPQIVRLTHSGGDPIPAEFLDEVRAQSEKLTLDHKWKKSDLVMIDNRRFMHGRRNYPAGDPRDIMVVQAAQASFGYGCTMRSQIARSKSL